MELSPGDALRVTRPGSRSAHREATPRSREHQARCRLSSRTRWRTKSRVLRGRAPRRRCAKDRGHCPGALARPTWVSLLDDRAARVPRAAQVPRPAQTEKHAHLPVHEVDRFPHLPWFPLLQTLPPSFADAMHAPLKAGPEKRDRRSSPRPGPRGSEAGDAGVRTCRNEWSRGIRRRVSSRRSIPREARTCVPQGLLVAQAFAARGVLRFSTYSAWRYSVAESGR